MMMVKVGWNINKLYLTNNSETSKSTDEHLIKAAQFLSDAFLGLKVEIHPFSFTSSITKQFFLHVKIFSSFGYTFLCFLISIRINL
jgi:hypothetical protein